MQNIQRVNKNSTSSACSEKPLISIIVPVYNGQEYLKQCVDSCLQQTYHNFELVLVDDGSTDQSGHMCDAFVEQDSRVHVVHKPNGGLMDAWMKGLAASSAPYIMFLDCDDWLDLHCLEQMQEHLELREQEQGEDENSDTGCMPDKSSDPEQVHDKSLRSDPSQRQQTMQQEVICCSYVIDHSNGQQQFCDSAAEPGDYTGQKLREQIQKRLLGNERRTVIFSRCMKLISRGLLEQNLHYCNPSIRMGEDVNIMYPVLLDAKRIVLMDHCYFYHYRFVDDSMVHRYDAGMYENIGRLRSVLLQVAKDKHPEDLPAVKREYGYLFLIEMKNELRRPDVSAGCVIRRIREICLAENSKEMAAILGAAADPANKLILFCMKRPDAFRIGVVRQIFRLRDAHVAKT